MTDNIERQLLNVERPEPSLELRERVLAAAMPLVQADDNPLDRLWFSPMWRVAAVLALVVLAGAEVVSNRVAAPTAAVQNQSTATSAQTVAMAAAELGLSPAEAASLVAQVRTSNNEFEGVNR